MKLDEYRDDRSPRLQHFGLATSNLDAMLEWYRNVLGMTLNHTQSLGGPRYSPWMSAAFVSNDEVNHRIAIFEMQALVVDPQKPRHARLQHVGSNRNPRRTARHIRPAERSGNSSGDVRGSGRADGIYYSDPDQNSVELNVNNYGNEWTATEHIRTAQPNLAMSIRRRWWPPARRAPRTGICTSAPSPASSHRKNPTTAAPFSEAF